MTRRPPASTKPAVGPTRDLPTCTVCGASGMPGPDWSPYIGCNGDPANHNRPPIGDSK